jgi:hypothetical protein
MVHGALPEDRKDLFIFVSDEKPVEVHEHTEKNGIEESSMDATAMTTESTAT